MFLFARISVLPLLLLAAAISPLLTSAQDAPVATCPANTVSEAALTLPSGEACKLCAYFMDKCKASCKCSSDDTCDCVTDPPECGIIVCPGDESEDCNACEAPDQPGTFYCVGDSFVIDEGSSTCASCTCDDADGGIGCVSCSPPSMPEVECSACEAPDQPGMFYCVGDRFVVDEGSSSCASCECVDEDGGIGCVPCNPPSMPDEDCSACEDPDQPGMLYCVGDRFVIIDEGSGGCASCECDDEDGAIGCVPCNPPSIAAEGDEAKEDDKECSVTANVGCVLMDNESIDCNEYVPNTPENCEKQVKFTLEIDQQAPPLDIMLESIYRYRVTSPFGTPRAYSEDKWGTNLTPFEMQYYKLNTWEGEYVNFCVPTTIETTLEYKTSCATTSATYVLQTIDVFPGQAGLAKMLLPDDGEVRVAFFKDGDTTSSAVGMSTSFLVLVTSSILGAFVMMI